MHICKATVNSVQRSNFTSAITAKTIKHSVISSFLHSQSHTATVEEGREDDMNCDGENVSPLSFSHFAEMGVTNRRGPFVSRRIVTGFVPGLATIIIRVEQAGWERAILKLEGSKFQ